MEQSNMTNRVYSKSEVFCKELLKLLKEFDPEITFTKTTLHDILQDCKAHKLMRKNVLIKYNKKYNKKLGKKFFCHRISELIEWFDPEFVKDMLQDLNNKNENSD